MRGPSLRLPSARRCVQLLAVGTVAGSASMLLLPGAQASGPATTKPPVLQEAWFWQNAYEQANPPVAAPAAPPSEPSGVPDGDLAVAFTSPGGTSSSKMTALSWDVGTVPAGSTVSAFTFSLTLDSSPAATSFGTQDATIDACQPTRAWPAQMPGDYSNEPSVNCANKVAAKVDGSTYTFSIPVIAQSWIDDQNLGVAVVADPASAAPFQAVFKGAKDVKAQITYTAAASTSPATASTGGVSAGGASSSTAAPASSGGGTAPAPSVQLPTDPTGVTGSAVAPPVVAGVSPGVASGVAPATTEVAAVTSASSAPTGAFWVAAALAGVVVLVASVVLGDAAPIAAPAASGSRLERVLRQRDADGLTVRSL